MADPNRMSWPPGRPDWLMLLASAVVVTGLADERLEVVITGLVFAAFGAAIPRMRGRWEVTPRSLAGEFAEPTDTPAPRPAPAE